MTTVIDPRLQDAAHSLIENLLASEAFVAYQTARTSFNQDPQARSLLEQLSESQAALRKKQARGGATQAELDALRELQAQVRRNENFMAYAQTQQEAVNFLREINTDISQLLGMNFASLANHATC